MFFSGDASSRKRVDLGGRSSKERDRQVLLEEARLERKRRSELRQRTAAAIVIQVSFTVLMPSRASNSVIFCCCRRRGICCNLL